MPLDPRRNPRLITALELLAPGSELRLGIDDIIKGHLGALLVIADRDEIQPLVSGGLELNTAFTPQMLYELAKMDGAILLDADLSHILAANVHLMPDASIPTSETGTRHRTAERVSRQIGVIVVSISQERDTVNVYTGGARYQLESISELLAKATQGLQTLKNHCAQLSRGADDLTLHELRGNVTIGDVLMVLQRSEMAARMIGEVGRNVVELGLEGRLVAMQLGEMSEGVPEERIATIRDYRNRDATDSEQDVLERLRVLTHSDLVAVRPLAEALGYTGGASKRGSLRPLGYRALAGIAHLNDADADRIIAAFLSFDALMRATLRELSAVEGIAPVLAADVQQGLRRLQDRMLSQP